MHIFMFSKGLSNDDFAVARGVVSQDIRPGTGFKPGDFAEEKFGGATVERLVELLNSLW